MKVKRRANTDIHECYCPHVICKNIKSLSETNLLRYLHSHPIFVTVSKVVNVNLQFVQKRSSASGTKHLHCQYTNTCQSLFDSQIQDYFVKRIILSYVMTFNPIPKKVCLTLTCNQILAINYIQKQLLFLFPYLVGSPSSVGVTGNRRLMQ